MAREFVIDDSPSRELLPIILSGNNGEDFEKFYHSRMKWYGYHIIQDRFCEYGLFDDLIYKLKPQIAAKLVPYATEIAINETNKRFSSAVYLLADLCDRAAGIPTVKELQTHFSTLLKRVRMLSFHKNIIADWNKVVNYYISDSSMKNEDFVVLNDSYLSFIDTNFPSLNDNSAYYCPVPFTIIEEKVKGCVGNYKPLRCVRTAKIGTTSNWVWLYENIEGNVWHWYILICVQNDGSYEISKRSMHSKINITPEKLLLDFHYGANDDVGFVSMSSSYEAVEETMKELKERLLTK